MTTNGFTIIELLVVISVISLLSSVVLSSLNSARQNATEAAIKSETLQLMTYANQTYLTTGSYSDFGSPGVWILSEANCDSFIYDTATNYEQARDLCYSILNRLPAANYNILIGCSTLGPLLQTCAGSNRDQYYGFTVKLENLNGTTGVKYFCVSSEGSKYEGLYNTRAKGCFYNP